jgi:hypothetical protein
MDPQDDVARAAAPDTPFADLARLAESLDPAVRRAVIRNPVTPREVLLRLAVTDWWELWRRPGDGQEIMLERIATARLYTADLQWLRSLDSRYGMPPPIHDAVARMLRSWAEYDGESGPEHRRMTREHGAQSIEDIDD